MAILSWPSRGKIRIEKIGFRRSPDGMKMRQILRLGVLMACAIAQSSALEPVPEKVVVLTFDDSVASHYTVVRPILKRYGFGATFFISEGFGFLTNKQDYMTWAQIAELHRDGFEI